MSVSLSSLDLNTIRSIVESTEKTNINISIPRELEEKITSIYNFMIKSKRLENLSRGDLYNFLVYAKKEVVIKQLLTVSNDEERRALYQKNKEIFLDNPFDNPLSSFSQSKETPLPNIHIEIEGKQPSLPTEEVPVQTFENEVQVVTNSN